MEREITRHREAVRKQFVNSPRYAPEVEFKTYAGQMGWDTKRGRAGA